MALLHQVKRARKGRTLRKSACILMLYRVRIQIVARALGGYGGLFRNRRVGSRGNTAGLGMNASALYFSGETRDVDVVPSNRFDGELVEAIPKVTHRVATGGSVNVAGEQGVVAAFTRFRGHSCETKGLRHVGAVVPWDVGIMIDSEIMVCVKMVVGLGSTRGVGNGRQALAAIVGVGGGVGSLDWNVDRVAANFACRSHHGDSVLAQFGLVYVFGIAIRAARRKWKVAFVGAGRHGHRTTCRRSHFAAAICCWKW